MRYCTVCGTAITKGKKFCTGCGGKLGEERLVMSHALSATITAIVVFGVIIFVLLFFRKSPFPEEIALLGPTELVETVKQITAPQPAPVVVERRREGYTPEEKPFEESDYAYDQRTPEFRLVCTMQCPVSKAILDQELAAIAYAVSTLRGLTKSDINKEFLPFEVHASEDKRCPLLKGAAAYQTTYVDVNGNSRGLLCFFYEKMFYDRSKFPYSTSIHEVAHLFLRGKYEFHPVIDEGLAEVLDSFFLKGNERNSFCWRGNEWYAPGPGVHDPHPVGRAMFFKLCKEYGFDYDDLPVLFGQINQRGGYVSQKDFVGIINSIVGADTSTLFREAGVEV